MFNIRERKYSLDFNAFRLTSKGNFTCNELPKFKEIENQDNIHKFENYRKLKEECTTIVKRINNDNLYTYLYHEMTYKGCLRKIAAQILYQIFYTREGDIDVNSIVSFRRYHLEDEILVLLVQKNINLNLITCLGEIKNIKYRERLLSDFLKIKTRNKSVERTRL